MRGFAPITLAGSRDLLQETSDDLEAKMTCPSRDKRFHVDEAKMGYDSIELPDCPDVAHGLAWSARAGQSPEYGTSHVQPRTHPLYKVSRNWRENQRFL